MPYFVGAQLVMVAPLPPLSCTRAEAWARAQAGSERANLGTAPGYAFRGSGNYEILRKTG